MRAPRCAGAFAPENENVNLGKNYKVNGKDYKWQKKAEWGK